MNRVMAHESLTSFLAREGTLSIVTLVNTCIHEAYALRASDIHIAPRETDVSIRFRIDGELHDQATFPKSLLAEVISRIKVLSSLRSDEHQAAQDGRFRFTLNDTTTIDVRVSILPTYYGENAILRLLAQTNSGFTLTSLGIGTRGVELIQKALSLPHGMILATGPTGSGKTTTLYTLIQHLNVRDVSIVTIEDPIEYAIPNVTQISVNTRTSLTFANGLRSILRQDPNVIMVGEIRDSETARIAVNTALTGHLLLSTIHTNDAATTLPRLLDMGVDAYLVASTMNIAIAQRLIRTLCPSCKKSVPITPAEREHIGRLYKDKSHTLPESTCIGTGCTECDGSGYRGRVGIYEVLEVTPNIREEILSCKSSFEIRGMAIADGMETMLEDGLKKAFDGTTSLQEVFRTIHE
jgi:type II secretory ATPase GspE/PulE/Tfp pilus assembly ATPase PilB-like protein